MAKSITASLLVALIAGGCSEYSRPNYYVPVAAPMSVPPAAQPGAAAAPINLFQGAAVGAPIAGLPGASWADPKNTGYVTGYTLSGKYYPGVPPGYDSKSQAVIQPH